MDTWQLQYRNFAAFVCIGCAGPATAEAFSTRLKLKHTTVAVAATDPTWGQLGCNGLIVLDRELNVVLSASAAFMEVRDLAFRHVEAVLDAVIAGTAVPRICPGQEVILDGLSSAELNGERALCLAAPGPGPDGRCAVQLDGGRQLSVKSSNLVTAADAAEAEKNPAAKKAKAAAQNCEGGNCALPVAAAAPVTMTTKEKASSCGSCDCGDAEAVVELGFSAPGEEAAGDDSSIYDTSTGDAGDAGAVAPLGEIGAVNVDALDDEHEQCAAALGRLADRRDRAALQAVLAVYEAHFAHEEELLDTHMYTAGDSAAAPGSFNAVANQRTSHYNDHSRLKRDIASQLARGATVVPAAFVDRVLRDFEAHANTYDDTYAEQLPARLRLAAA